MQYVFVRLFTVSSKIDLEMFCSNFVKCALTVDSKKDMRMQLDVNCPSHLKPNYYNTL